MRLASYAAEGGPRAALVDGSRLVPLREDGRAVPMRELLERGVEHADRWADLAAAIDLEEATIAPVVPDPHAIWCAALTFMTHVAEAPGREAPPYPLFFLRHAASQVGHLQPIVRPAVSDRFDYEGELAAVIGRAARHVPVDEALDHVAGFSCYNEGSVRDWQRHSPQITPGKNFEASGSFGPWLVTRDEFGDPRQHSITTQVNGEVRQQAGLSELLFPVEYLIHYLSTIHTLRPGDVVVCGTPGGVGVRRDPPTFLEPGDLVTVEIDGIGCLENTVVQEQAERTPSWRPADPEKSA